MVDLTSSHSFAHEELAAKGRTFDHIASIHIRSGRLTQSSMRMV